MEKTELPTAERLEELRQKGVTPVSHESLRLLVVATVLFVVGTLGGKISAILSDAINNIAILPDAITAAGILDRATLFFVPILLIPVVSSILFGLLQTKFTIKTPLTTASASADMTLLQSFRRRFLKAFMASLIVPLILVFVATAGAYFIWPEILKLFVLDHSSLALALKELYHLVFFGGGILALILSLTVWLVGRYRFMLDHRMTRAQVNNKERE